MDLRDQLQDARAEMLMAQTELDDFVMNHPDDSDMFESLMAMSKDTNQKYSKLLREYMEQKYPHLKEHSDTLGILNPAESTS